MNRKEYEKGIGAAIGCSVVWGILPVYWQALSPINSWVIIVYRIFLVCVVAVIMARMSYSWKRIFEPLKDRKVRIRYFTAGLLITVNWSTYIWAVNAHHVIQTCVGYYIEPLMVCIFGMVFFRERLTKYKSIALILAMSSVVLILVHFHAVPTIALVLAITFSTYSAIKKTVEQPPLISLVYETIFLAPPALCVIIWMEVTGKGALGVGEPYQYLLLLLCGLLTVIPLGLFAAAAKRVSMFMLGLTEYISPSLSLIVGVLLLGEPLDKVQFIAFAIIWLGLVFFSYGEYKDASKMLE
ncbi:EamA family transporter RarD [Aminicella lysinilytica]|mgnify:FL=1|uniref:Chloramphenicol-sensitive protein RarD n=1 Tax=Aminicella lysinilytica TaxID=433323 RepID=A0A4R6Q0X1_9FIRM|nr:EamA family transporter RarD [Aminicella lysinilytica]TDP54637.1 chloramphenicol-sensitive protein RarD [Aminicella lysinilytica]